MTKSLSLLLSKSEGQAGLLNMSRSLASFHLTGNIISLLAYILTISFNNKFGEIARLSGRCGAVRNLIIIILISNLLAVRAVARPGQIVS